MSPAVVHVASIRVGCPRVVRALPRELRSPLIADPIAAMHRASNHLPWRAAQVRDSLIVGARLFAGTVCAFTRTRIYGDHIGRVTQVRLRRPVPHHSAARVGGVGTASHECKSKDGRMYAHTQRMSGTCGHRQGGQVGA